MTKNVYFHIGHAKCGSSSIQRFCDQNREQLLADGFYYPSISDLPFHGEMSPTFYKSANQIDRSSAFVDSVLREIKNTPAPNVILSSESFFDDEAKHFDVFKEFNVRFIYYVRPQDALVESALNQRIKEGNLNYLYSQKNEIPYLPAFDFLRYIKKFTHGFGDQAISVRIFDQRVFVGEDLIQDFLFAVGCAEREKYLKAERVNSSLGEEFTRFAAHLALISLTPIERRLLIEVMMTLPQPKANAIRIIEPEYRVGFLRTYREQNREMTSRYLTGYVAHAVEPFIGADLPRITEWNLVRNWMPNAAARRVRRKVARFAMSAETQRKVFFSLPAEWRSLIISRTLASSSFDIEYGGSYVTLPELPDNSTDYQLALLRRGQVMVERETLSLSAAYRRFSTPVLIEVFGEYNIVFHRDVFYGVPKTMPVDWEDAISYCSNPKIIRALSMKDLRAVFAAQRGGQ